jgi:hypothetical protein
MSIEIQNNLNNIKSALADLSVAISLINASLSPPETKEEVRELIKSVETSVNRIDTWIRVQ